MAKFLTTNGISFHIEEIIKKSKKEIILLSPYLQLSKTLFERIKDTSNNNVKITIVYGKDELKPNQKNSLMEIRNVEIYFFENLHAKCYLNENNMIITSMNIYEFSEKNNREMGILIDRNEDKLIFENALEEIKSILSSSEKINLKGWKRYENISINGYSKLNHIKIGYCIRCEKRIELNINKPYCTNCYMIWSQFQNEEYIENVCHSCGEYYNSKIKKPLCFECYKKEITN